PLYLYTFIPLYLYTSTPTFIPLHLPSPYLFFPNSIPKTPRTSDLPTCCATDDCSTVSSVDFSLRRERPDVFFGVTSSNSASYRSIFLLRISKALSGSICSLYFLYWSDPFNILSYSSVSKGPITDKGGLRWVTTVSVGMPSSFSTVINACPVPNCVSGCSISYDCEEGPVFMVSFSDVTTLVVNVRLTWCTRLPSCESTEAGTSWVSCVQKKMPTPFERIRRIT